MPEHTTPLAITAHREAMSWSKRRLAREAGMSAPYIVQLENAERPLTPKAVARIAEALGMPTARLLFETGFISPEHMSEAESATERAMHDPDIVANADEGDIGGKYMWLIADYLNLLGDDPYGLPNHPHNMANADWSKIAPERVAERPDKVFTDDDALRELQALALGRQTHRSAPPTDIEGWSELSDADHQLVQRLVNRLRRDARADQS
jgi:transcriptional regulator with XRE-family HTH domain